MIVRIALVAAALGLGAAALWHPVRPPLTLGLGGAAPGLDPATGASPAAHQHRRRVGRLSSDEIVVVYVAGAVAKPGLYRLRAGDRYAQAVALAGGMNASADPAGVNLAARAGDGDEIYVPVVGESSRGRAPTRHGRRRSATPPPASSVDLNAAGAATLAAVPGIGRAVAQRIVEMRAREGNFTSIDELLDVAGMTQARLERVRPYLREP
jgi:competence protein ComEA